jgi:outer membrane lipoprotein-sorting protein
MKLLFVPVLAAALTQAGDDPEKVFRAMEAKIAEADSLLVTFTTRMEAATKGAAVFQGQVTIGDGNRVRIEGTAEESKGQAVKLLWVSDGKRIAKSANGKASAPEALPQSGMRPLMTLALARMGIATTLYTVYVPGGGPRDPLNAIKVSDFKLDKGEKVNGRDALVIHYKLTVKDHAAACTVWVDAATQLPLKRVFRADDKGARFTVTETYGGFAFGPKLDPGTFDLPN